VGAERAAEFVNWEHAVEGKLEMRGENYVWGEKLGSARNGSLCYEKKDRRRDQEVLSQKCSQRVGARNVRYELWIVHSRRIHHTDSKPPYKEKKRQDLEQKRPGPVLPPINFPYLSKTEAKTGKTGIPKLKRLI